MYIITTKILICQKNLFMEKKCNQHIRSYDGKSFLVLLIIALRIFGIWIMKLRNCIYSCSSYSYAKILVNYMVKSISGYKGTYMQRMKILDAYLMNNTKEMKIAICSKNKFVPSPNNVILFQFSN